MIRLTLGLSKQGQYAHYLKLVSSCEACPLKKEGQHCCPAWGNLDSKVIFVGEAPGRVENPNLRGIVFVGNRSSDQYHEALEAPGSFGFFNVFHTNVVKCNPPQNRKPTSSEVRICEKFLRREINIIKPKMIVAVGRTAADFFGIKDSIQKAQLKEYSWHGIPVYVVYHPAYILRMGQGKYLEQFLGRFRILRKKYDELCAKEDGLA